MARILKTVRAELDLDEIWLFIATDNVGAADALIDAIAQTARRLAEQPLMGRARPELAPEIRSFTVGRYVLFYRPLPNGVELVRAIHSARDLPTLAGEGGFTD